MKNKPAIVFLIICLFFSASLAHAAEDSSPTGNDTLVMPEMSFSFAIINDNYIAKWKKGTKGNYFGADDFLTVSLVAHSIHEPWQTYLVLNTITSRKFNYRYDLLSILINRKFNYGAWSILPEAGVVLKGEIGGESLQNAYHSFRALDRVHIPYSREKGISFALGVSAQWQKQQILFKQDAVLLSLSGRSYADYIPGRLNPAISYIYHSGDSFQAELFAETRWFINSQKEYSSMARSGLIYGTNLKIRTFKELYLDVGFVLFPSKNVESEKRFPQYTHDYLPQFWIAFSWKTIGQSLRHFINY